MVPMVRMLMVAMMLVFAHPVLAQQGRVLIFSHSTGYRHASIEPGIAAISALVAREGMAVEASESPELFNDPVTLARFDAIVLLNTTTDPNKPESEWLVGGRRAALQAYVRGGGGIVAVHAAADSHYGWDWYGRMIGGRFQRHPEGTPRGQLTRHSSTHPATRDLPDRFARTDEWYYYDDFDPTVTLLLTLDPQSIGAKDVNPNPVAWAHVFEGGRIFFTGLGHTEDGFADPALVSHLRGGLRWARRR